MKAVVVDIQGKDAVVLNKSGQFVKVKNSGPLQVGQEMDIPEQRPINASFLARAVSVAAVFFIVMGLGYGAYSYNTPYSYVNIDINPSIEFAVNRYDKIINAVALNDDGVRLVSQASYKNMALKTGIESIIRSAIDEGYLVGDNEDAVMLTVASKDENKAGKIEKEIELAASQKLKDVEIEAKVLVEKVTEAEHNTAKSSGITPGRQLLIDQAVKSNPQLKIEDLKKAPVKELIKSVDSIKREITQKNEAAKSLETAAKATGIKTLIPSIKNVGTKSTQTTVKPSGTIPAPTTIKPGSTKPVETAKAADKNSTNKAPASKVDFTKGKDSSREETTNKSNVKDTTSKDVQLKTVPQQNKSNNNNVKTTVQPDTKNTAINKDVLRPDSNTDSSDRKGNDDKNSKDNKNDDKDNKQSKDSRDSKDISKPITIKDTLLNIINKDKDDDREQTSSKQKTPAVKEQDKEKEKDKDKAPVPQTPKNSNTKKKD